MHNETKPLSIISSIIKCFRANKILMILVPSCLITTGFSEFLNYLLIDYFSKTNEEYSSSNFEGGFILFRKCVLLVISHYLFSQITVFTSQMCSLVVFRAFLCAAVNSYTNLDYTEFHTKGSGKIQDDINRSSRAAKEIVHITAYEMPKSIIEFGFAYWGIFTSLSTHYFLLFTLIFYFCAILASFIAIFCFKNEKYNIFLYRKSFIPLADILHNFDIIKAFNKEEKECLIYKSSLDPFMNSCSKYYIYKNIFMFLQKSSLFFPQFFIYYSTSLGKNVWRSNNPPINIIVAYNSYFTKLKKTIVSLRDQVFLIIREKAEMKTDLTFENSAVIEKYKLDKKTFDHQIRLSNVDLYAGENIVQKKQNFIINKGDKIAITGTNGSGKTVFVKSLMKFFKSEGDFYIDDVSIKTISARSLRYLIAYAPQDPHIFNNTVLYNLGYSQNKIDEQKIYECCQNYHLHEFFKSMKNGYHTDAGEKGKYLSGGQKQRISFMRAIIKDAPIIIMDEPTANIDKKSEIEMIRHMMKNSNDKTVLLIVHSNELLKEFDKILYFTKEGVVFYDSYASFINRDINK